MMKRKRLQFRSVEEMKAACEAEAAALGMTLDEFMRPAQINNRVLRAAVRFARDHLKSSEESEKEKP